MSRPGLVIALSGVDCAGKSTQRQLLMAQLRVWGYAPVPIWSRPGYSRGLALLRKAVRRVTGRRRPEREGLASEPGRYPRRAASLRSPFVRRLWLTAALVDLIRVYGLWIRMLKARGSIVVCDRYLLDCLVDFRVNFPDDRVEERWLGRLLRRLAVRPDAAFCLLVPPAVTAARGRARGRFNWEAPDVLHARARLFRRLSDELAVQPLDGERPPEELAEAIRQSVLAALGAAARRPDTSTPAPPLGVGGEGRP